MSNSEPANKVKRKNSVEEKKKSTLHTEYNLKNKNPQSVPQIQSRWWSAETRRMNEGISALRRTDRSRGVTAYGTEYLPIRSSSTVVF
jgi:hypothetical protein